MTDTFADSAKAHLALSNTDSLRDGRQSNHVSTQSEFFFGGAFLNFTIDKIQSKSTSWTCEKCGTENLGQCKKECQCCGAKNPKYAISVDNDTHQPLDQKRRAKLLKSRDIFGKVLDHFPRFTKYTNTKALAAIKVAEEESQRPRTTQSDVDFVADTPYAFRRVSRDLLFAQEQDSTLEDMFGGLDPNNPFGINNIELHEKTSSMILNREQITDLTQIGDSMKDSLDIAPNAMFQRPSIVSDDESDEVVPPDFPELAHLADQVPDPPDSRLSIIDPVDDTQTTGTNMNNMNMNVHPPNMDSDDLFGSNLNNLEFGSLITTLNAVHGHSDAEAEEELHSHSNALKPRIRHCRQRSQSVPASPQFRPKPPRSRARALRLQKDWMRIDERITPLLFALIHVPAASTIGREDIVMENIVNVVRYQYDGVFFVNHGYMAKHLVPIIRSVHSKYPSLWLGAKFLQIKQKNVFKFVKDYKLNKILKGVWCESAGIVLEKEYLDDIFIHNVYDTSMVSQQRERSHSGGSQDSSVSLISPPSAAVDSDNDSAPGLVGSAGSNSNQSVSTLNSTVTSNGSFKKVKFHSNHDNGQHVTDSPVRRRSQTWNANIQRTASQTPIAKNSKKRKVHDSAARSTLTKMKKYKFKGLYFGGVDLKTDALITIPSSKTIRSRRRWQSFDQYPISPPIGSARIGPRIDNGITPTLVAMVATNSNKSVPVSSSYPGRERGNTVTAGNSNMITQDVNQFTELTSSSSSKPKRTQQTYSKTPKATRKGRRRKKNNRPKLVNSTSKEVPVDKDVLAAVSPVPQPQIDPFEQTEAIEASETTSHQTLSQSKPPRVTRRRSQSKPPPERKSRHKSKEETTRQRPGFKESLKDRTRGRKRIKTIKLKRSKTHHQNDQAKRRRHSEKPPQVGQLTGSTPKGATKRQRRKFKSKTPKMHMHANTAEDIYEDGYDTKSSSQRFHSSGATFWSPPPPLDLGKTIASKSLARMEMEQYEIPGIPSKMNIDDDNGSVEPSSTQSSAVPRFDYQGALDGKNGNMFDDDDDPEESDGGQSVYSMRSMTSIGSDWSESSTLTRSVDDYYFALNKLGKYASKGYMHVMVTGGEGKNVETKLKALRAACSKKCILAVANGVRIENVHKFLPFCDILMVDKCISSDPHHFDPKKMNKFKKRVDRYFEKEFE